MKTDGEMKAQFENHTRGLFDRIARRYDTSLARWYFEPIYRKLLEIIKKEVRMSDGARVLDVACGTGEIVVRLAKKYPASSIVGMDIAPKMLEEAKKKTKGVPAASFVQGNAERLPFDNASFDLVLMSEAFHHFWEPQQSLAEIYRVLKKGGVFILADPGADTLPQKIIFKYLGPLLEVHKKVYTQDELRALVEEAVFSVNKIFRYHMNNFLVAKK